MTSRPAIEAMPYSLSPSIQHYDWGTKDDNAFIPRMLGITPLPGKPYAELWVGAHANAPSGIRLGGETYPLNQLPDQIRAQLLGSDVENRFSSLPFLFKILSINQALSIQAHPNKQQARALHLRDPKHYADSNHKPELAIALDGLHALVGFRTYPEIVDQFNRFEALASFVAPEELEAFRLTPDHDEVLRKRSLKNLYANLMGRATEDKTGLSLAIRGLADALARGQGTAEEQQVFATCYRQYGPDVGLFSILLLNMIHLKPGQGVFLPAGTPHAYLSGNIVECMANSDNVVRAGLTPKFKDLETLVDILTYHMGPVEILGEEDEHGVTTYTMASDEFQVHRYELKNGDSVTLSTGGRVALAFVAEGALQDEKGCHGPGTAWLLPAHLDLYRWTAAGNTLVFSVTVPAAAGG